MTSPGTHPDVEAFLAIQTLHPAAQQNGERPTQDVAPCGCVVIGAARRPIYRCPPHFADDFARAAPPSANAPT